MRGSSWFGSPFFWNCRPPWHFDCPSSLSLRFPTTRSQCLGSITPLAEAAHPTSNANHLTAGLLDELRLETVCDNAKCPNRMECYSQKTATFMILGNVCTRPCGFCAVHRGDRPSSRKPTNRSGSPKPPHDSA